MSDQINSTLGDLVKAGGGIIHTGPFGSQLHAEDYVAQGIPCIMPANMKDNRVDLSKISFISDEDAQRLSKYLVKEGDIVYSRRGNVTLKALIREKEVGYFCGTGCLLLRPGNLLDSGYLTYYLSTPKIQSWIISQAIGATMPNLNTGILARIPFSGPEKAIQEKISSVLKAIDDKLELNNRINAELEAMAKTLHDYWFVQFDFPDANGKPYKTSGGKMNYSTILKRKIPASWEFIAISDILEIKTGKEDANFSKENGRYHFFTCGEKTLYCDEYSFDGKAILLAGNGTFSVKKYDGKFNAYQRTYVLMPKDENLLAPLYYEISNKIEKFTSGSRGSIVKFITKGDIENIVIPLPKNRDLSFMGVLTKCFSESTNLYEENLRLTKLRDWLLPLLMNGQVMVK